MSDDPHPDHDRNMTGDDFRTAGDVEYEQRLSVALSRIKHDGDITREVFFSEAFANYCHDSASVRQGLAALAAGQPAEVFGTLFGVAWKGFLQDRATRDWLVREYGKEDRCCD